MKNTTYLILILGVILAVTILTSVDQSNASPAPEPKRRKGSSGSSRKSGTSWFGSSSSNSGSSGSSWFGGNKKNKNQGNLMALVSLDTKPILFHTDNFHTFF